MTKYTEPKWAYISQLNQNNQSAWCIIQYCYLLLWLNGRYLIQQVEEYMFWTIYRWHLRHKSKIVQIHNRKLILYITLYTHINPHTPFQWTQWCPEVNDDWSWLTEASVWVVATDGCGCAGGLKLLKSKQPPRLTSWLITSSTLHSTGGNLSKLMLSSSNDRCDEPIICPTTVADMLSSCWSFNMLSNDIHSWKGKII